jgi:hypothetical protein
MEGVIDVSFLQQILNVIMKSSDKDLIETLVEYQKDIMKKSKVDMNPPPRNKDKSVREPEYWKIKDLNVPYYDPRTLKQISKTEEDSTARKIKMKKNKRLLKMI